VPSQRRRTDHRIRLLRRSPPRGATIPRRWPHPRRLPAPGGLRATRRFGQTPGSPAFRWPRRRIPTTVRGVTETGSLRRRNGSGHSTWSNWCGACHGDMHSTGHYVHPVDTNLGTAISTNYRIIKAPAIASAVPERTGTRRSFRLPRTPPPPTRDGGPCTTTAAYNAGPGPASSDQVMLPQLATGRMRPASRMLRWNMETTFITQNGAYPNGTAGTNRRPPPSHGCLL